MNRHLILTQAVIYAAVLTACGDGKNDDGRPPVEIPLQVGGIWNGSVVGTIDPNPATPAISATAATDLNDDNISFFTTEADIASGISQFRLVSDSAIQAVGEILVTEGETSQDDDTIAGSFTAYAPDGYVFSFDAKTAACTLTGVFRETINPDSPDLEEVKSIDASYECRDTEQRITASGRLLADYNAMLYEQPSSFSRVEGIWSGLDFNTTNNNVVLRLTVAEDDGTVSGLNDDGCIYDPGQIEILDPAFNLYGIALTVTNCSFLNGSYDGLATLKPGLNGAPDEFIYQIDDGVVIVTQPVFRDTL